MQADDARGREIDSFVILAKGAKGNAAKELIKKAIETPRLFFFGELLDCPNIVELENTADGKAYVDILRLFAYGDYTEYKQSAGTLPALSEGAIHKLKQLSIVSAAAEAKLLAYDSLMSTLDINSVRELEDLIIDNIYQGLLKGKMEQKTRVLQVYEAVSRDVKPGQISAMKAKITNWLSISDEMLRTIEQKIEWANTTHAEQQQAAEKVEQQIEATKKALKVQVDLGDTKLEGMEFGFDDPSNRPKSRFKTDHKMNPKQFERRQR